MSKREHERASSSVLLILLACLITMVPAISLAAQSGEENPENTVSEEEETSTSTEKETKETGGGSPFVFDMGVGLGATVIDNQTYQTLSLYPDIAIGKLGIGLDINFRYRLLVNDEGDISISLREEDWIPENSTAANWINLYLSKFNYIRWDQKGAPLYVKAGTLDGATLGTGFTLGGYTNALFKPQLKIFGLVTDLDGRLFNFPYVGIETVIGNFSQFDVVGARLYVRPLAGLDIPVMSALQVGATVAMDNDAFLYLEDNDNDGYYDGTTLQESESADTVFLNSFDLILPVLSSPIASLSVFIDGAFQPQNSLGIMAGLGGKLINLITYGGQIRYLGENFIPGYFGPDYDLTRALKYQIATSETTIINSYFGYLLSTGVDIADSSFIAQFSLDGPMNPDPDAPARYRLPHLNGTLILAEDVIPMFFFDAHYDKFAIDSWESFTSLDDAIIGATVNYKSGPAVISVVIDAKYNPEYETDPTLEPWDISTRLETRISF